MAFTGPHVYLVLGGRAYTTEEWQVGFRLASESGASIGDVQTFVHDSDFLDDVVSNLEDVEGLSALWHPFAFLDYVKASALLPTGKLNPGDTPEIRDLVPGVQGTSGAGPAQVAICSSHLTELVRGRASRGRAYWPITGPTADAVGGIAYAFRDQITTTVAAVISAINEATGAAAYAVSVMSELGAGATERVTRVTVGSIPDTQRRRRNHLTEVYSTPVAVTGA